MNRICNTVLLTAFVALLSAGPAFTQTPSPEGTKTAPAPVAYVYLQTSKGVDGFAASADGKLELVKGSPFKTTGAMAAGNGSHFITLGKDLVHSYAVEANGAIGKQVSEINTQDYKGSECGDNTGSQAVLDHTGRNLYVQLDANVGCAAIQTYNVAKGSGALTFRGATPAYDTSSTGITLTITGNDALGYALTDTPSSLLGYKRESEGTLEAIQFHQVDPTSVTGPFWPLSVASAPNNLVAIVCGGGNEGGFQGAQLASYVVDGEGNITSKNTWENMPYVTSDCGTNYPGVMDMSPSGKLLAVINYDYESGYRGPWGLSIFHFNGTDPVTPFGAALDPSEGFFGMSWDNNNHLYALSGLGLHVYSITPAAITEAPGSPYSIDNLEGGLVVVAK